MLYVMEIAFKNLIQQLFQQSLENLDNFPNFTRNFVDWKTIVWLIINAHKCAI